MSRSVPWRVRTPDRRRARHSDRRGPTDLRLRGNRPETVLYLPGPCLLDGPVSCGRGLRLFPLAVGRGHPYVEAVVAARAAADPLPAVERCLASFYTRVQPSTAAEWLGVEVPSLQRVPAWAAVFPWAADEPDVVVRERGKGSGALNTIAHNARAPQTLRGHRVRDAATRLLGVLHSIEAYGFRRTDDDDGDVGVAVLLKGDGSWRWIVYGGQHRASVAAALELGSIPIRVHQVVMREQVQCWPNVLNGTYTVSAALAVFDRVFSGDLPASAARWWDDVDPVVSGEDWRTAG